MKQYAVYVEHSTVVIEKFMMVVTSEANMKEQLLEREENMKFEKFVSKPQREKSGKIIMHEMNSDWDLKDPSEIK